MEVRRVFSAVVLWLAAGGLCFVAPAGVTEPVETAVRDALLPGQRGVHWLMDRGRAWMRAARSSDDGPRVSSHGAKNEVARWRLRCRRLEVEAARLREELQRMRRTGASPYRGSSGERLMVPELLEARVLGRETVNQWRAGRLLDRGTADGVPESALVLEGRGDSPLTPALSPQGRGGAGEPLTLALSPRGGEGVLVDQGESSGLAVGQPVYAGRTVIGRIGSVGRWTSTVLPVTDASYRGLAQLARRTEHGPVFGARGILAGTDGRLCELRHVSSTEAVEVGDAVYTGGRDGGLPYPMYYGRVVKAELKPGSPHWEILVEPAAAGAELETVEVLRVKLNAVRLEEGREEVME